MTAIETADGVGLQFTKVLDTVRLGYVDDDEEVSEKTDRNYWETNRGTKKTVAWADLILDMARTFEPSAELNYNKHYIGFLVEGRTCNFAICRPQKNAIRLEISLPQMEEFDEIIERADLDILDYDKRFRNYRIKLIETDLESKNETLIQLMKQARDNRK